MFSWTICPFKITRHRDKYFLFCWLTETFSDCKINPNSTSCHLVLQLYDSLLSLRQYNAAKILSSSNLECCPYCNSLNKINFLVLFVKEGTFKDVHFIKRGPKTFLCMAFKSADSEASGHFTSFLSSECYIHLILPLYLWTSHVCRISNSLMYIGFL